MYKYLPSKKFIIILSSIIISLAIIFTFSYFRNKNETVTPTPKAEIQSKVQEFMTLDTDSDDLKDWEEALWKTDPKNPDTDNDGTSDGSEVEQNREPTIANTATTGKAPNDFIDPQKIEDQKKAIQDFKELTSTERIGRELFSQYLATKQLGSTLTENQILNMVENSISNIPDIIFKTYTEKDITISNSVDNESLRKYSNSLAGIIMDNFKISTERIDTIIEDATKITSDDKLTEEIKEIFKRFDPLILKNMNTVNSLLELTVPSNLVGEHLKVLNSFQEIYEGLDMMQKSADNIIILIPLINRYDTSVKTLTTSIANIVTKLSALKVDYKSKDELGYQLFNVIMLKK